MKSFIKKNYLLLIIIILGIFFRTYKPVSMFIYNHDQDLTGWIIRDILGGHLRLIGQETSSQGVFIGPIFYYALIPFYLLFNMDPIGSILLPVILSVFAIYSFYFVFTTIFEKRVGLIASFLYSLSLLISSVDREVVPTMPVMLWSCWFFYGLHLLYKDNKKSYLLLGLLAGLVWHLNLALFILMPLIPIVYLFSKRKFFFKEAVLGFTLFVILLSPFFVFEVRHNFLQSKSIYLSLTSNKDYVTGTSKGLAKIDRVLQLVHRNTNSLFISNYFGVKASFTLWILTGAYLYLLVRKKEIRGYLAISALWVLLYVVFFSFNSINPSEYYLNGMNVIWIFIASFILKEALSGGKLVKLLAATYLFFFLLINFYGLFDKNVDRSNYLEKKELIEYIKKDASIHNYPCVSVSYITSPGRDLGYRYLFWLSGLHVNRPISGSPVYSIVFPHDYVNRLDKTFGALGLVLPDYQRYNRKQVELSCSGQNSNLTDPMPGFTK